MRRVVARLLLGLVAVHAAVAAVACSLTSLDGLTGGAAEGGADAEAVDGAPDASNGVDAPPADASPLDAAGDGGAAPAAALAAAILQDQPLAYWRFDELSGAVAHDATGHGHDCTYVGPVRLGAPGAVAGDTAVRLPGVSGAYVDCGNGPFAFADHAPFTLEAWTSPEVFDSVFRKIFSKEDPGTGTRRGYDLVVTGGGTVLFERWELGAPLCTRNAPVAAVRFSHVVAVFDGAAMRVYVDAQASTAAACSDAGLGVVTHPLFVGAQSDANYGFFQGSIDEVAIYDHALGADRVSAHFAAASP